MTEQIKIEDYYEIGEKIGQGGNGVVYKAIKKRTNKEVAIKILDKRKIKDSYMTVHLKEIYQRRNE